MPTQTYATHAHRPTGWLVTGVAALIAFVFLGISAVTEPTRQSIALAVLGAAVVSAVMLIRGVALRLQDRIIRLEMQVRLVRLGREAEGSRLSLPQLVALRFASDAELPSLLDRAAAEGLAPDAIKRAVRDWQGDHLRT